jgi:hypothetical protein
MGGSGHYRVGPELRKKARKQFHYRASILVEGDLKPRPCSIADISESGAKVTIDAGEELPERFVLLLTPNGSTRRLCRVVWHADSTFGVKFVRGSL